MRAAGLSNPGGCCFNLCLAVLVSGWSFCFAFVQYSRYRILEFGNCIAWSIPCLIWIFSQNFWWFLVAAIFNTAQNITSTSEECLWVDDIPDEDETDKIIHWQYIVGLLLVFVAPMCGFLVARQGKSDLISLSPHKFICSDLRIAVSPPGARAGAIFYRFCRAPAYTGGAVLAVMEPLRRAAFQTNISHRAYPLAQAAACTVGACGKFDIQPVNIFIEGIQWKQNLI